MDCHKIDTIPSMVQYGNKSTLTKLTSSAFQKQTSNGINFHVMTGSHNAPLNGGRTLTVHTHITPMMSLQLSSSQEAQQPFFPSINSHIKSNPTDSKIPLALEDGPPQYIKVKTIRPYASSNCTDHANLTPTTPTGSTNNKAGISSVKTSKLAQDYNCFSTSTHLLLIVTPKMNRS